MKIERTNRPMTVPVSEIKSGEVFEFQGWIYMITECVGFTQDNKKIPNAVNLNSGHLVKFHQDEPVLPQPDAKVVL